MKSFFGFFGKIFKPVLNLFTGSNLKKADAVAEQIKDMIRFALPAVELVASFTPTQADDVIVGLIKKFMIPAPVPANGKFDPATIQGVLMMAAQVAVRNNLSDAIKTAGTGGLKIGEKYIKDHTDIPDSVINAATNAVYAILKNSGQV